MRSQIEIPEKRIAQFCRGHGIRRLSIFGSALRSDYGPESDIDILVEFLPEQTPGFLGMARLQRELSHILGGRTVDLRTPEDLSPYFRDDVLEEAEVAYAEG